MESQMYITAGRQDEQIAVTTGPARKMSDIIRIVCTCVFIFYIAASARGSLILELDPTKSDALSAAIHKIADEAYQVNLQGLNALDEGNLNAAMDFFDQAVKLFPQYSDAHNNRGVVFYRRGNVGEAQRVWENVVKLDPAYYVSYYNIGLIHLHSRKYDEAIRQFGNALRYNKGFTEAMLRTGVAHMQNGNTAGAVEWFERAWRIAPTNRDAWSFYSYGLLAAGDTARAVTVLQRAGDNVEALAQLGRIEGMRGRHAQAAEYLARAVSRGRATSSVLLELAIAQTDAGNCKGALSTLSDYFTKESKPSVDAWLLAGFAAKECDDLHGALNYYERGLARHPRDQLLLHNAGQVHFAQNNHEKAEEIWNKTGEEQQTPHVLYQRAIAARARNDLAAAERHVKTALSMDERADYHDFLGVLYATRGDTRKGEEHFRSALRLDPNHASAQLNLAVVGIDPGNLDKAIADASRRLASCRGKNCADAALQLSMLHYRQQKPEKAIAALESLSEAQRDIRIYRHIAIYNRVLQRHDRAVTALETAAAKFRRDTRIRYELAEAYLAAGSPAQAVRIFEELLPRWRENVWRLHYQMGYAYMELNDLPKAKASFERSLAAQENAGARALLAFVLNRMGDTEKAVSHWERVVAEDADNATIHINLGLSYEGRGEYARALESYQRARSLNPSDRAIHINIGNAYKGMGRIPEAFDSYTAGLESGKRDLAAYNIFLLARARNDNDRAERMYALLKREFPASVHYLRASGEMNLVRGDTARALSVYESIKDKDVDDWYALSRIYAARGRRQQAESALANLPDGPRWGREKNIIRARLAFSAGDFRGAYQLYRDIINSAGTNADIAPHIHNMTLAAHNAGMHKEAIAAAGNFAERVDGKTRIELSRIAGQSAIAVRDWAEAKKWYSRLTALEPNNSVSQYNLAVAHYNLGEAEDAYNRYQRARALDGKIQNRDIETRYAQLKRGGTQPSAPISVQDDSLTVWYNQAVDFHNSGKDTLAENLYRKILERDPAHSHAWNNLGAIYGARGELDQAVEAYTKSIEIAPAPETYANLANVYIALQDFAKARDIIAQGLKHSPRHQILSRMEREIRTRAR